MNVICPVCHGNAREDHSKVRGDHKYIDCPQCGGEFEIGGLYCYLRWQQGSEPLPKLSAALRRAFEQNVTLPMLVEQSAEELLWHAPSS
jgi:hypothetical protein